MEFYVKRTKKNSSENTLAHNGIKGQKWGVRRFQNEDGTWTNAGKARYGDDIKSSVSSTVSSAKKGLSGALNSITSKVSDVADAIAFEAKWAATSLSDDISPVVDAGKAKVNRYVKEFGLSDEEKAMRRKYEASKEFYFDGTGKKAYVAYHDDILTGNLTQILHDYPDWYDVELSAKLGQSFKPVDMWQALRQYFTNILSILNPFATDEEQAECVYNELLNSDGKIDSSKIDSFVKNIGKNFKSAMGTKDTALSEEQIKKIGDEFKKAAKMWNDMVDAIDKQGLSKMFFNENNKKLDYPMLDGEYSDREHYSQSLGAGKYHNSYYEIENDNRSVAKIGGVYVSKKHK